MTEPVKAEDRLSELRSQATQGEWILGFAAIDAITGARIGATTREADAVHWFAMHNTQEPLLEVVRAARAQVVTHNADYDCHGGREYACPCPNVCKALQALDAKVGEL